MVLGSMLTVPSNDCFGLKFWITLDWSGEENLPIFDSHTIPPPRTRGEGEPRRLIRMLQNCIPCIVRFVFSSNSSILLAIYCALCATLRRLKYSSVFLFKLLKRLRCGVNLFQLNFSLLQRGLFVEKIVYVYIECLCIYYTLFVINLLYEWMKMRSIRQY